MKIAVPMDEKNPDTKISMTFGRAPYYLFYDTETKTSDFVLNTAAKSAGGAGIRAAQIIADNKADVVLTPRCGRNAADVLLAANVKIYKSKYASAKENIDAFLADELSTLDEINAGFYGK